MDPFATKILLTRLSLYSAWFLLVVLVSTAFMAGTGYIPVHFALLGDIILGVSAVLCMLFAAQAPADPNAKGH